jgi:hypothetical protein
VLTKFSRGSRYLNRASIATQGETSMRYGFLALAFILFFAWIGAFLVFHVVAALIHILLILALIAFVIHLFSGRGTAA